MSLVDLSLYLPVAKNCCVEPTEMEGLRGLILMESSSGPAVPEELIDEDPPQSVMPAAKHKPSKSVSDRRRVLVTLEKCIFPSNGKFQDSYSLDMCKRTSKRGNVFQPQRQLIE